MTKRPIRHKSERLIPADETSIEKGYIPDEKIQRIKSAFVRKYTALLRQAGYSTSSVKDLTRLSRKDDAPNQETGDNTWQRIIRLTERQGLDTVAYVYYTVERLWFQKKEQIFPCMLLFPRFVSEYARDRAEIDDTTRAEWASQDRAFDSECFSYASMMGEIENITEHMKSDDAKKYATLSSKTPLSPLYRYLRAYLLNLPDALSQLREAASTQYCGNVAIYDDLIEEGHSLDMEEFVRKLMQVPIIRVADRGGRS